MFLFSRGNAIYVRPLTFRSFRATFWVTERCGGNYTIDYNGMRVRRLTVQNILKELDSKGRKARKAHSISYNGEII